MKTFLFLSVAICMSLISSGQGTQSEQLVRQVVLAFQADFNQGGFKKAAIYTSPDWVHINPGGGITKGRAAVLQEVRAVHQGLLKGVTMTIESMTVLFVAPDVVLATVVHQISAYEMPKGVAHRQERQIKTYVIVRRQGKWLLTQDQNTIIAR